MTIAELASTLSNRRKGLAYRMWKQANLNGAAFGSENYPQTPEDACPELYPPKVSIKMPSFLKEKWARKEQKKYE